MRLVEIECSKCSTDLDIDLDNLLAYSPYCGHKLRIDMKKLHKIYEAKEKTKHAY